MLTFKTLLLLPPRPLPSPRPLPAARIIGGRNLRALILYFVHCIVARDDDVA